MSINISEVKNRKVYTTDVIREMEKDYLNASPSLMSRAAMAIAERVKTLFPNPATTVLIVVGPGNNGGDAIMAAGYLSDAGYCPTILSQTPATNRNEEIQNAYQRWEKAGGKLISDYPAESYDLIIDGLFGIGVNRPISSPFKEWIDSINQSNKSYVLAVDVPTGLNADTGEICGDAIHASETLTFMGLKPGLLTGDGPDYSGIISLDALQTECKAPKEGQVGEWQILEDFIGFLPSRKKNSNKGNFGTVGIIGGNEGMVGAALMAGRAAQKCGAGRVTIGLLSTQSFPVDVKAPELMIRTANRVTDLVNDELIKKLSVLVLGPGMGTLVYTGTPIIRNALTHDIPVVLDADALNFMATDRYLFAMVAKRTATKVITPHPGEAARLLQCSVADIQQNRLQAAHQLAMELKCWVVLKGVGTIIMSPEGAWKINSTGNPGMSSGGMGDALSGMIAAFIAQHVSVMDAVSAAVCLHGAAADSCVQSGKGPIGLTASEVIDEARTVLNKICAC